jgi:hypothetical protein
MIKIDELLIDIIDDAFNKIAWQGPMHLINIIEQLSFDQIIYSATTEGYCVWQLVLHCAYWKWNVANLLVNGKLDEFPRKPDDFPYLPEIKSVTNWEKDYNLLIEQHRLVKKIILEFPEERWWEITKPPYDQMTYIKRGYGLAAHDVYHTAQIRNMGIPNLK